MHLEEYRASGIVPPSAVLGGMVSGLISALILGPLYATIIYHNPFIYLNVVATVFFGLTMGVMVNVTMRERRSRNAKANGGVALLMTAIAYALSWIFWVGWTIHGLENFTWTGYLGALDISALFEWIGRFHEHGTWGLSRRSAAPVSGHLLTLIWSLEAIIIFGLAAFSGVGSEEVFCERCKAWSEPREEPIVVFGGAGKEERIEGRLRTGDFSFLSEATPIGDEKKAHYSLVLSECESCSQTNAISLIRHTSAKNKARSDEIVDTPIVKNLIISEARLYDLRARIRAYHERVGAES